jgi:hypothetical protein
VRYAPWVTFEGQPATASLQERYARKTPPSSPPQDALGRPLGRGHPRDPALVLSVRMIVVAAAVMVPLLAQLAVRSDREPPAERDQRDDRREQAEAQGEPAQR